MTDLIVADPIRIPSTLNLMCYSLLRLINGVGAEIGTVILKCRTEFRICAASGILCSKEGSIVSHDMRGHVAAAVIDQQAGHIFAQWMLNPPLRIARFIRCQSPGSEQAPCRLGLSEVWRRDHRIPNAIIECFHW